MTTVMPIDEPRPRGTVLGERTDRQRAFMRPNIFSDARRTAVISTRDLTWT
jgi:hypothetical protein